MSIISVAFSGCDFKPKAIGNDNELAILVDADVREAAEGHLLAAFCPIVDTPQPEHRFIPVWGDFEAISRLQTYRFILLVGTLDGKDKLSGLVQQMLSDEIIAGVRRGDYFVFQKKSEWARDQLLLILVAENRQQLIARLENDGQDLYQLFVDERNQVIHDQLFHSYEQKSIAAEIQENYGIKLRI
ncbi:DUF4837 family protein, partial [bacterium]|nr:DUF4837 family protein [bacterium]